MDMIKIHCVNARYFQRILEIVLKQLCNDSSVLTEHRVTVLYIWQSLVSHRPARPAADERGRMTQAIEACGGALPVSVICHEQKETL